MRLLTVGLYLIAIIFCLCSCTKERTNPIPTSPTSRTVIAYLAANNNLSDDAYTNINQMEEAIGDINGNLIVYTTIRGANPALYKISADNSPEIKSQKIKEYLPHNSSDPLVMRQVLEDIKTTYPSQSFGLILWSHASGWIPPDHGSIKVKSFGDDNGSSMDIKDLNHALYGEYDFILFDACSMASIEVLYEIKDKAKYFISSPAEVIASGMPYQILTKNLFGENFQAYKEIAQKYYDYYNAKSGLLRSATISVIDAKQLTEFAKTSKQLLSTFHSPYQDLKRSEIQRMDFDKITNPLIAFDLEDFFIQNFGLIHTQQLVQQLRKTALYKANTPFFNGYTIKNNGGITCYIPNSENEGPLHNYYRSLAWYRAGGFDHLF
ncbi:clostripain-related cysteine peptidase [Sphingobacterium sp. UBA6320]|jgi:hypothetical protein|uniref:clostripain-related cysteine peptidase n=1 Tax=Sphingobacterium sp. UBA6320 TaxID=1947510 RepID=UPI0025DDDBA6|nr:clostripain-related cysteine peptidase [Sphingobacterium sp. UBA6320]